MPSTALRVKPKLTKVARVMTVTGLATGGTAGAGVLAATPAFAGTNGQELRICNQTESVAGGPGVYGFYSISGFNQRSSWVHTWVGAASGRHDCYTWWGAWFKGEVNINAEADYSSTYQNSYYYCYVPPQMSGNVYTMNYSGTFHHNGFIPYLTSMHMWAPYGCG